MLSYDSRSSQSGIFGIHVFDISNGGDTLVFNQTLAGSIGSANCVGSIAVSESRNKLFAVDNCSDTVSVFDTVTLAPLAPAPSARSGNNAKMVAVGHLREPSQVPSLCPWGTILLTSVLVLLGLLGLRNLRA